MAKSRSTFVCQACGSAYPRWAGRCEACGEWNSIVEEAPVQEAGSKLARRGKRIEFAPLEGSEPEPPRRPTGIGELDRVSGGGLVRGSAFKAGGAPRERRHGGFDSRALPPLPVDGFQDRPDIGPR